MLEKAFASYRSELKAAEQAQHQATVTEAPEATCLSDCQADCDGTITTTDTAEPTAKDRTTKGDQSSTSRRMDSNGHGMKGWR